MGDWIPVPLVLPPNESVDEVQLEDATATIVDAVPIVVNQKLNLVKRPGLNEFINLGTGLPIDGLFWWPEQRVAIAVSDGRVWKILDNTGTRIELTGSSALLRSALVSFASNGTRLVMANGGAMVHTALSGPLTTMADPDAPTTVSHVAFLDQYILANRVGTGEVDFSNINDLLNWTALDFFTAEGNPDNVLAMSEAFREIIALGEESVEFFVNDGVTPFARISGASQPYGTSAPYSLARTGGTWMWLDQRRRLVTMQGRQVIPVSTPYDRLIQRFVSVDDAIGYTTSIDGLPIYVLNFPSAKQTLAYNYETQQWHKWGYWDLERAEYQRYRGQTYCYAKAWNLHLVGDYTNGIIYKADPNVFTDNGNPIRSLIRSGQVDYGKFGWKRSNNFRLRCKRSVATESVPNPMVSYRRRHDHRAQWRNERWKSLGVVGRHEIDIDWRRNGRFRTAQHELVHTDDTNFVIVDAQEDIDYLGH